jgi:hypothetical protein
MMTVHLCRPFRRPDAVIIIRDVAAIMPSGRIVSKIFRSLHRLVSFEPPMRW